VVWSVYSLSGLNQPECVGWLPECALAGRKVVPRNSYRVQDDCRAGASDEVTVHDSVDGSSLASGSGMVIACAFAPGGGGFAVGEQSAAGQMLFWGDAWAKGQQPARRTRTGRVQGLRSYPGHAVPRYDLDDWRRCQRHRAGRPTARLPGSDGDRPRHPAGARLTDTS
jgi:hypothetical protein